MATAPPLAIGETAKAPSVSIVHEAKSDGPSDTYTPRTRWEKVQEVIWDGGHRTPEERKLVQRLDIYVMSWATFGYFVRLLDSGNISKSTRGPRASRTY